MKSNRTLYMAQTAVMLALLIGTQFVTRSFGQLVMGSLVNMILLISVFMIGTGGGLIISVLSPFLAFFVGFGPAFIQIVPFVAVGNVILVSIARLVRGHAVNSGYKSVVLAVSGIAVAGLVKTAFLWFGLVVVVLPMIPGLNENQAAVISATFTWPQIVTALIGGALAVAVVPMLKKVTVHIE